MSIPLPKKSLGSHCSAIYKQTLYTFSADAFQSLSLTEGAEWNLLPSGIAVSGGQCVHAHRDTGQEALYIVGGTTSNTSTTPDTGFMGLQRWVFADQRWETLVLPTAVTFNLTNHGATFLHSSQQVMVLSGTVWPDTSTPSANTYLIDTTEPFAITAVPAATQPLLAPMVLPWGDSGALIVGGDTANTGLKVYTTDGGWEDLSATLPSGLPARGKAGATLVDGDDGSRMLITFDMTTTPTTVTETMVKDSSVSKRQASSSSSAAASPSSSSLTMSNWPTYDSDFAPATIRNNTSLAYENDVVVISGGDDQDPLAIFDGRQNSWLNVTQLLVAGSSTASTESTDEDGFVRTMSSSASTSTATGSSSSTVDSSSSAADATATGASLTADASSSASAEAVASSSSKLSTTQLLGAVLGSVLGVALSLGLILFFLRRRRHKQTGQDGKGRCRMSFQDRGASFMQEAGTPRTSQSQQGLYPVWGMSEKGYAPSSIYSASTRDGPVVRAVGGVGVIVNGGSTSTFPVGDRNVPSHIEPRGSNSGWSRYFSGTSATNLVGLQPAARAYDDGRSSAYTDVSVFLKDGPVYTNPYLYNAGPGVVAGGIGIASSGSTDLLQRSPSKELVLPDSNVGRDRRSSAETASSAGASSFSSGISESMDEKPIWSPVGGLATGWEEKERIPSSVYPDSPMTVFPTGIRDSKRETAEIAQEAQANNLSWLVLSQN